MAVYVMCPSWLGCSVIRKEDETALLAWTHLLSQFLLLSPKTLKAFIAGWAVIYCSAWCLMVLCNTTITEVVSLEIRSSVYPAKAYHICTAFMFKAIVHIER